MQVMTVWCSACELKLHVCGLLHFIAVLSSADHCHQWLIHSRALDGLADAPDKPQQRALIHSRYDSATDAVFFRCRVQEDDIGAHINVGRTYTSLQMYDKAEQAYRTVSRAAGRAGWRAPGGRGPKLSGRTASESASCLRPARKVSVICDSSRNWAQSQCGCSTRGPYLGGQFWEAVRTKTNWSPHAADSLSLPKFGRTINQESTVY